MSKEAVEEGNVWEGGFEFPASSNQPSHVTSRKMWPTRIYPYVSLEVCQLMLQRYGGRLKWLLPTIRTACLLADQVPLLASGFPFKKKKKKKEKNPLKKNWFERVALCQIQTPYLNR